MGAVSPATGSLTLGVSAVHQNAVSLPCRGLLQPVQHPTVGTARPSAWTGKQEVGEVAVEHHLKPVGVEPEVLLGAEAGVGARMDITWGAWSPYLCRREQAQYWVNDGNLVCNHNIIARPAAACMRGGRLTAVQTSTSSQRLTTGD